MREQAVRSRELMLPPHLCIFIPGFYIAAAQIKWIVPRSRLRVPIPRAHIAVTVRLLNAI